MIIRFFKFHYQLFCSIRKENETILLCEEICSFNVRDDASLWCRLAILYNYLSPGKPCLASRCHVRLTMFPLADFHKKGTHTKQAKVCLYFKAPIIFSTEIDAISSRLISKIPRDVFHVSRGVSTISGVMQSE